MLVSLLTASQFAGGLFAFLAAHLLQNKRKMPYMVWAWTLGRGLFLLTLFVSTPLPFVLITVGFWILSSFPMPAYTEVMREIYPDAYRGRAMAYVRVSMTGALIIVTPIAGQLLDVVGFQVVFPIAGLFGIASALLFGRIRFEEEIPVGRRPLSDIWAVLKEDVRFRAFSAAFMVFGFGNLMTAALLPIFMVDELRLSYGQVGFLGLVFSLFWMLGCMVWGRAIDRRGSTWTLKLSILLTVAVPVGFFLATDMRLVAVTYAIYGITNPGVDMGWINAIISLAPRNRAATYTGLFTFLLGIRGLTAPFAGAALLTTPAVGMRGALAIAAILIAAGWLMMRRLPGSRSPAG